MILRDKRYIVFFLAPALLLITAFLYFPLVLNVIISFTDLTTGVVLGDSDFVGFKQYTRLFDDPIFYKSFWNTIIVMIGCLIFEIGIAMALAFLVDTITKGFKFFRTVFFFPVMISGTAIGLMFYLMYDYEYGILNSIVVNFFNGDKVEWLTETSSIYLVLIPIVWQYVGFYFVIFLTAMATVPQDIYESAMLDGITGVKKAIYITIPLIWDVIATSCALVIAGTFKVFDVAYVIANGAPLNSSELLSTFMNGQISSNNAYAAAIATIIIIIGFVTTLISNFLTKKETVTY